MSTMPAPLPSLLNALTRLGGGDASQAEEDLLGYLGVSLSVVDTWSEIPRPLRARVSDLCRASGVHWERREHDLFRSALAQLRQTGEVEAGKLHESMRDRVLPEDRRFLAASLIRALVVIQQGRPVRGQRWALPPDSLDGLALG